MATDHGVHLDEKGLELVLWDYFQMIGTTSDKAIQSFRAACKNSFRGVAKNYFEELNTIRKYVLS